MKLTCPHSGLEYYTSNGYGTASAVHPATQVPLKKLVSQLTDFTRTKSDAEFSDADKYLYLLAWLNHLTCVSYRNPASFDSDYPTLLANADPLFKTVLSVAQFPHLKYPQLIVSSDSTIHSSLRNWLTTFNDILAEHKYRSAHQSASREIARIEDTLDRITSRYSRVGTVRAGKLLAKWAATVAEFPAYNVTLADSTTCTLSTLWQSIIEQSFIESPLQLLQSKILPADLSELIEYCEDNIPHGTHHAFQLMRRLRAMESLLGELTGVSPMKVSYSQQQPPVAKLQRNTASAQSGSGSMQRNGSEVSLPEHLSLSTKPAMPAAVPATPATPATDPALSELLTAEPQRSQFPTTILYLRAKAKWQSSILAHRQAARNASSTDSEL